MSHKIYGQQVTIIGSGGDTPSEVHPRLNVVSITKSSNNLNISNPSTNGNFVAGYKIMSNGEEVTRVTASPLVLTSLEAKPYAITVRADGVGFLDSPDSNSIDITVYAFVDGLKNVTSDFDFKKTTSGMNFSFTIVPMEGYKLPASIAIKCKGEDIDFSYNPYTGDVTTNVPLETEYSDVVTDGGQLISPTITLLDDETLEIKDVAFATQYEIYDDENAAGTVDVPAGGYIGIAAEGIVTPQLMKPLISVEDDTLSIVDGFLKEGDVFYAESYTLYDGETVLKEDIDATQDQNTLFTYKPDPTVQWSKLSDGAYKTATSSSYANTYAYMRINILAPKATKVKVDYTFYPYNSYVRMYIGKLDVAFTKSNTTVPTSSQYQVASSGTSTTTSSFTIDVPAGAHFIDIIKQYNTTSTSSTYYNRYCQVKVTEVVEETA